MVVNIPIVDALIWVVDEIKVKVLSGSVAGRVADVMRALLVLLLLII